MSRSSPSLKFNAHPNSCVLKSVAKVLQNVAGLSLCLMDRAASRKVDSYQAKEAGPSSGLRVRDPGSSLSLPPLSYVGFEESPLSLGLGLLPCKLNRGDEMSFPTLHDYLVICFIELGTWRLRVRQGLLLISEKIAFCIENGGTIALWYTIRRAGHRRTPLCPQQAFIQSSRPLGPALFLGHAGVFALDAFMISFSHGFLSFLFWCCCKPRKDKG